MSVSTISREELNYALSLRDLSDPAQGSHSMQILVNDVRKSLAAEWGARQLVYRALPIVSVQDNYDHLGYASDGVARNARYTRYVTNNVLLRTQTSAAIPTVLRMLSQDPVENLLLVLPGLAYRRDVIDRIHSPEPNSIYGDSATHVVNSMILNP